MVKSFAARVRTACLALGDDSREFTVAELVDYLLIQTAADQKRLTGTMRDMKRADVVIGVRPGVYRLTALAAAAARNPKMQQVMWRVLRARRTVTIADLAELAGASEAYAREWLRVLARREVVRRLAAPDNQPHSWQLIEDSVEMPDLDENAAKLRRMRKEKALAALGRAEKALAEAREIISKENDDE